MRRGAHEKDVTGWTALPVSVAESGATQPHHTDDIDADDVVVVVEKRLVVKCRRMARVVHTLLAVLPSLAITASLALHMHCTVQVPQTTYLPLPYLGTAGLHPLPVYLAKVYSD